MRFQSIPCNVITGFLGVGKTTTILHLLKQKPANEIWAVLVNEFGEIGLDGALIDSGQSKEQGVFIREVPGGCMCCASGLPMQIALNMLLMKAKPDRLLIEPTGLGHPREVLKVLSGENYQKSLSIQNTITLVDARHFSSQQHINNTTFQQQLDVADMIVANKSDLASPEHILAFEGYLATHINLQNKPCIAIQNGELDVQKLCPTDQSAVLYQETISPVQSHGSIFNSDIPSHKPQILQADSHLAHTDASALPECGYLVKVHCEGEFSSVGWRISKDNNFDLIQLSEWLVAIKPKRVKAILRSETGFVSLNLCAEDLNKMDSALGLTQFKQCDEPHQPENRIEIIFEGAVVTEDMINDWSHFLIGFSST